MRRFMTLLAMLPVLAWSQPARAQAIPIVDSATGQLVGATGVVIQGVPYDVTFVEGTCAEVYDGCNELSDLPFTGQITGDASNDVILASEALLEQVFMDGPAGNFDSEPSLTFGCGTDLPVDSCAALTPFLAAPSGSSAAYGPLNAAVEAADFFVRPELNFDETTDDFLNPLNGPTSVWVRWTLAASPEILLTDLALRVASLNAKYGIVNSLDAKIDSVFKALEDLNANNDQAAANALEAFIHAVEAQQGKQIATGEAEALIALALRILERLG